MEKKMEVISVRISILTQLNLIKKGTCTQGTSLDELRVVLEGPYGGRFEFFDGFNFSYNSYEGLMNERMVADMTGTILSYYKVYDEWVLHEPESTELDTCTHVHNLVYMCLYHKNGEKNNEKSISSTI